MVTDRLNELVNGEIDKANSAGEVTELSEHFARNPEVKALQEDLLKVARMLDSVEASEPSPNVRKRILNSIDPHRYQFPEKRDSIKIPFFRLPSRRHAYLAYAFLGGLLIGVVVYSLIRDGNDSYDMTDLYGTILRPGSTEKLETGDLAEVNLNQVSGTVRVKYSKEILLAQLSLKTQREIEILLEFDRNSLSFSGFGAQKTDGNNLSVGKDYFRLTNNGENKFVVVFRNIGQPFKPLELKIFSSGTLLYQKAISTGELPN